jgi:hypothetical protein
MESTKTYMDLLKEHAQLYGSLSENDFEFISQLHEFGEISEMPYTRSVSKTRLNQIVSRLHRKIPYGINYLANSFIELRKKELELKLRERRIEANEKLLQIENNRKILHLDLYLPLHEHDLSVRVITCLRAKDIKCFAEMIEKGYTKKDLLRIRNLGAKCIKEIQTFLEKYGIEI